MSTLPTHIGQVEMAEVKGFLAEDEAETLYRHALASAPLGAVRVRPTGERWPRASKR